MGLARRALLAPAPRADTTRVVGFRSGRIRGFPEDLEGRHYGAVSVPGMAAAATGINFQAFADAVAPARWLQALGRWAGSTRSWPGADDSLPASRFALSGNFRPQYPAWQCRSIRTFLYEPPGTRWVWRCAAVAGRVC